MLTGTAICLGVGSYISLGLPLVLDYIISHFSGGHRTSHSTVAKKGFCAQVR